MANNENLPACAACKYQRKKCAANCILRRHFPASKADDFMAVHKIFGVANVTKMMRGFNSRDEQDKIAMSLFWEAAMWVRDPVRGPYGAYMRLQDEIRVLREYVNRQQLLIQNINMASPNINRAFHGNTMMNVADGNGNSNYSIIEESGERGDIGLAYPFGAVGAVSQRPLFPGGAVRHHVQGIGVREGNNRVSVQHTIRNRDTRIGSINEATNQEELDVEAFFCQQQHYNRSSEQGNLNQ